MITNERQRPTQSAAARLLVEHLDEFSRAEELAKPIADALMSARKGLEELKNLCPDEWNGQLEPALAKVTPQLTLANSRLSALQSAREVAVWAQQDNRSFPSPDLTLLQALRTLSTMPDELPQSTPELAKVPASEDLATLLGQAAAFGIESRLSQARENEDWFHQLGPELFQTAMFLAPKERAQAITGIVDAVVSAGRVALLGDLGRMARPEWGCGVQDKLPEPIAKDLQAIAHQDSGSIRSRAAAALLVYAERGDLVPEALRDEVSLNEVLGYGPRQQSIEFGGGRLEKALAALEAWDSPEAKAKLVICYSARRTLPNRLSLPGLAAFVEANATHLPAKLVERFRVIAPGVLDA